MKELNLYLMNKNKKVLLKEYKLSRKKINRRIIRKSKRYKGIKNSSVNDLKVERSKLKHQLLRNYVCNNPSVTISANYEIGIEEDRIFQNFLKFAQKVIDAKSVALTLDFKESPRIWPSAITLLCSLKKWTELTCYVLHCDHPSISSTIPKNKNVDDYLIESGFYDFVSKDKRISSGAFNQSEIVKITRETKRYNIIKREKDIRILVKNYSTLDGRQNEIFSDKILPEIINNVTEHGVAAFDQGWWILGQYHPKHKLLSVCIADNGIGFKNSLLTGPQKEIIKALLPNNDNEGDYMNLAFKNKISGALNASIKDQGLIIKSFQKGSSRGAYSGEMCRGSGRNVTSFQNTKIPKIF